MRKFIALLLAAAMVFSLAIVAGADDAATKQTAKLAVTCTVEGDIATFTIKLDATGCEGVAALQFTLEPENMTYKDKTLEDLASVFKLGTAGVPDGDFDFTVKDGVGKYIAYGGEVKAEGGRYLSGTTKLMTVQYQLNDGAESGTLKISDFKACQSGDKAIGEDGYTCTAPESVTATRPSTGGTTLKGDVNGDGVVNGVDTNMIYRYVMGYIDESEFTEQQKANADVNSDGYVNGVDTNMIYRYVMGYIDNF